MAKKQTDDEILEIALERFTEIEEYEGNQRIAMLDDKRFGLDIDNSQWYDQDVSSRKAKGKPFITANRCNQYTDTIKNQERQSKPAVKVSATDEGANEKIAELRQGLLRHIQYDSKAQMARQNAYDDAVDMGRGHYIIKTEYVKGTMNQKIVVEPIKNPLSIYMAKKRSKPDYSDCDHGFELTEMSRKDFEDQHPDADKSGFHKGMDFPNWNSEDKIKVAEYYTLTDETRTLLEVEIDGQTKTIYKDKLGEQKEYKTLNIIKEREESANKWMWYKITSNEILESEELPWDAIPIVTVIGKEDDVEGKLSLKGLIRDIKQLLRMYNWVISEIAEIISKAAKAKYIAAEGQIEDNEDEWASMNVSDDATVTYKPATFEGHLLPTPQQMPSAGIPAGLEQQRVDILSDLEAITGINQAKLGVQSNETSGVAIRARAAQGDNSNFHYISHFTDAINHEGRVENSALHIVYDTARTITIMGKDDEESLKAINGRDGVGLGTGNFTTTVSVGQSSNSAKEEQASGMMEMFTKVGLVQETAADLVVGSQDWVGKDALADRLKKALEMQSPGLTADIIKDGEDNEVALLQNQLQQMQQQMQQMQQQAQQLQQALEKSNADKNAAEQQKQKNESQKLQILAQEIGIKKQEIIATQDIERQKLEHEEKKLEGDLVKNNLDNATRVEIADRNNQAEVPKIDLEQQKVDISKSEAETNRMAANKADIGVPPKVEAPKAEPKAAPTNVNLTVNGSKVKESTIEPNGKGGYNVKTVEVDK